MKKIMIYILLGLLALILIPIAFFGLRIVFDLSNPLRQPVEQIRADILDITPLGTSIEDAIEILEMVRNDRNWGRLSINAGRGVLYAELGLPGRPEDIAQNRLTIIGEHSLIMNLGGYRNFFGTGVVVWWAFDEDEKLIDVYVQKQMTGW